MNLDDELEKIVDERFDSWDYTRYGECLRMVQEAYQLGYERGKAEAKSKGRFRSGTNAMQSQTKA